MGLLEPQGFDLPPEPCLHVTAQDIVALLALRVLLGGEPQFPEDAQDAFGYDDHLLVGREEGERGGRSQCRARDSRARASSAWIRTLIFSRFSSSGWCAAR